MESFTGFIEPSLACRVSGSTVAVVADGRTVAVKPVLIVTGIANRGINRRRSMLIQTMTPVTAGGNPAAICIKMAIKAAYACRRSLKIPTMANDTGGQVLFCGIPMITSYFFIKPTLTKVMQRIDMTIMAVVRPPPMLPCNRVAFITDSCLAGLAAMFIKLMNPSGASWDFAPGWTEMAGIAEISATGG